MSGLPAPQVDAFIRQRRFRRCIPQSSTKTRGGLPEIHLSWVFLVDMASAMTYDEWESYYGGEDEVRIRA